MVTTSTRLIGRCQPRLAGLSGLVLLASLCGCVAPGPATPADRNAAARAEHQALFGNADLPRRLGLIENLGLQMPRIAPDGDRVLYLRSSGSAVSPWTLFGSTDPAHTPPDGTLSIWLRPTEGLGLGKRISQERWCHSAVWSPTGNAIAYVANEAPGSHIVHLDLTTGAETVLGVPGQLNCLPVFDADDETLLFCAGEALDARFRVYRQRVGDANPEPISPAGLDAWFPTFSSPAGQVLCAAVEGLRFNWIWCGPNGYATVARDWGQPQRPALLQTWAGIADPVAPTRDAVLFYDVGRDRICVLHVAEHLMRLHRAGSIAACWLTGHAIAIATPDGVFLVETTTGLSIPVFNGRWLPARYIPQQRRLLLFGAEAGSRLALWEVRFRDRDGETSR